MLRYGDLRGRSRRRHDQLLSQVRAAGVVFVRTVHEFRMVRRLHRARLITACISKLRVWGVHGPIAEVAAFAHDQVPGRELFPRALPR